MKELVSSNSSLNILKYLLKQKKRKTAGSKNDHVALRKFAQNPEFAAKINLFLSRIHRASEYLGLSCLVLFRFTLPTQLYDKEKLLLLSKILGTSKCLKGLIKKNHGIYLQKINTSIPLSETEEILLSNFFGINLLISSRGKEKTVKPLGIETKPELVETKCCCPPVFGCIIPPEVFSNPFQIDYTCKANVHIACGSNRCVHENVQISHECPEHLSTPYDNTEDSNLETRSDLEIYSSQLRSIVKDVCELVKKLENREEYDEAIEVDCWNTPVAVPSETVEVVYEDDGDHPLLDEGIFILEEENSDDISEIQELLLRAFSPREEPTFVPGLLNKSITPVCDPPCSIWCDSFKKTGTTENALKIPAQRNSSVPPKSFTAESLCKKPLNHKPVYKRSLSANDCLNLRNNDFSLSSQFRGFDPVSREKLILLRTDPLTYFKIFGHNNRSWRKCDETASFPSFPNSEMFLDYSLDKRSTSANCLDQKRSSMWGPFDGEDSLWQPLPDCVPSVETVPKHSAHKRVRDLRRQRSMN